MHFQSSKSVLIELLITLLFIFFNLIFTQFTRSPFQRGQNDDDEDEVITFEGNPSHNLPRSNPSSRRHTLSIDDYSDQTNGNYKTSAELITPTSSKNK